MVLLGTWDLILYLGFGARHSEPVRQGGLGICSADKDCVGVQFKEFTQAITAPKWLVA